MFSIFWFKVGNSTINYRMCAIITRGLYIYYPIFEVHFFVFNEVFFRKNSVLVSIQDRFVIKSGLWWRAYGIWKVPTMKTVLLVKNYLFWLKKIIFEHSFELIQLIFHLQTWNSITGMAIQYTLGNLSPNPLILTTFPFFWFWCLIWTKVST